MHPIRVLFCSLVLFASQAFQLQADWSTPLTIANPGFVNQPQVSINKEGKAIVVFDGAPNISTPTQIEAVTLIDGVASTPHIFPLSNSISASLPNVAINKKGNAAIAWIEELQSGIHQVVASSFVKGFYAPPTVLSANSVRTVLPGVTIDSRGDGLAVWLEGTSLHTISASRLKHRTWDTKETVFSSTDSLSSPVLAGNSKGDVIVAWIDLTRSVLQAARLKSGVWQVKTFTNSNASSVALPAVSINEDGDAVIGWIDGTSAVQAVRLVEGDWHAAKTLSDATLGAPNSVAVALDPKGNAVATWILNFIQNDESELGTILQASHLQDGRWKNPVTLAGPNFFGTFAGNAFVTPPTLVRIDSDGNAETVWAQTFFNVNQIEARAFNHGKWEAFTIISNPSVVAIQPSFAMSSNAKAVVVWNAGDASIQVSFGKHLFQH